PFRSDREDPEFVEQLLRRIEAVAELVPGHVRYGGALEGATRVAFELLDDLAGGDELRFRSRLPGTAAGGADREDDGERQGDDGGTPHDKKPRGLARRPYPWPSRRSARRCTRRSRRAPT